MGKHLFISYSHQQGDWVWNDLVPCLKAGGAEAHIDVERFKAGHDLTAQMDAEQDACDLSLLVLSPDYFASKNCQHEMQRAMASDHFVVVVRVDCAVPDTLKTKLYVDLRDDKKADKWDLLLQACDADLGATVPDWLYARDEIVRHLQRNESVNMIVPKTPGYSRPKWRELITHIQKDRLTDLAVINLEDGATSTRQGLVKEMLKAAGSTLVVPNEPDDLITLSEALTGLAKPVRMTLMHFDILADRVRRTPSFNVDLYAAWRDLMTEKRKLVLLIHSHAPFMQLLPMGHPLSSITDLKTVELHGRP